MKKLLMTILISCLLLVPAAAANPYSLSGGGNCALFAWEIMDLYFPVNFKIPGQYDAKDWVRLDSQERGRYRLELSDTPQAGDFIVFKANIPGYSTGRGHVAFVTGLEERVEIDFSSGAYYRETWLSVIESSDYADKRYFPLSYLGCLFRYDRILFQRDGERTLDEDDVSFLRLVENYE